MINIQHKENLESWNLESDWSARFQTGAVDWSFKQNEADRLPNQRNSNFTEITSIFNNILL